MLYCVTQNYPHTMDRQLTIWCWGRSRGRRWRGRGISGTPGYTTYHGEKDKIERKKGTEKTEKDRMESITKFTLSDQFFFITIRRGREEGFHPSPTKPILKVLSNDSSTHSIPLIFCWKKSSFEGARPEKNFKFDLFHNFQSQIFILNIFKKCLQKWTPINYHNCFDTKHFKYEKKVSMTANLEGGGVRPWWLNHYWRNFFYGFPKCMR